MIQRLHKGTELMGRKVSGLSGNGPRDRCAKITSAVPLQAQIPQSPRRYSK